MVGKLNSVTLLGMNCRKIDVEIAINKGLNSFQIVGLPDNVISESRERIKVSFKASSIDFPKGKIVVNLAPSDIKKIGSSFDLPIALGIIGISIKLKIDISKTLVVGELSLNGELRGINGILSIMEYAKKKNYINVFIPKENEKEASLIDGLNIFAFSSLLEVYNHVLGKKLKAITKKCDLSFFDNQFPKIELDMINIRGQYMAKRALMISAAGGHNIVMVGSPGSGKSLLGKAFQGIMPNMNKDEILEVTRIYSIAGLLPQDSPVILNRPYRVVHHSASAASIIGGGRTATPGEITLANHGAILFDEFAEFPSHVLENLRQPMEDKVITVSRVYGSLTYPANFILIAAMNPCKCGYYSVKNCNQVCTCSKADVLKYQKKISGPLYDRFDLFIAVAPVEVDELTDVNSRKEGLSSVQIRDIVCNARKIQAKRFQNYSINSNNEMSINQIEKYCCLSRECIDILKKAISSLGLTARAYHRIIKVSRTIADIEGAKEINTNHILEALQYRKQ